MVIMTTSLLVNHIAHTSDMIRLKDYLIAMMATGEPAILVLVSNRSTQIDHFPHMGEMIGLDWKLVLKQGTAKIESTFIGPPDLPRPTGYSSYEFSKHDQAANCHRDYRISYRPGLWSEHCLERLWGHHGSKNQRSLDQEFDDQGVQGRYG